jgi:DHA1 family bicyclomycin/chloramphenicol resistance-like MFS transporter
LPAWRAWSVFREAPASGDGCRGKTGKPAARDGEAAGAEPTRRFLRFIGAAPSILGGALGFGPAGLSSFFAATVLVVFGGGMMIPPLARRWGAVRVGMAGLLLTLGASASLALQGSTPTAVGFMAAVTLFLAGMGLINPIGSAIILEPFGMRAGAASALLGFLQMGLATVGTALIGALPATPALTLSWVMLVGTTGAAVPFYPMAVTVRGENLPV